MTLHTILIVLLIIFLLYLAYKSLKVHGRIMEGLENAVTGSGSSSINTAGGTAEYATAIKNETIKLNDVLLISKYRQDYENVIINMDDYVNLLMLQCLVQMDTSGTPSDANMSVINNLNSLNNVKSALNNVMKFVDSAH
jgi:hypothetical protein